MYLVIEKLNIILRQENIIIISEYDEITNWDYYTLSIIE